MNMDIKVKLNEEQKKQEILVEKKNGIEGQIKTSKARIQQYKDILDKEVFGEIKKLLKEKNMTVQEAMQLIRDDAGKEA